MISKSKPILVWLPVNLLFLLGIVEEVDAQFTNGGIDQHCRDFVESLRRLESTSSVQDLSFSKSDSIAAHFYWKNLCLQEFDRRTSSDDPTDEYFQLDPNKSCQFIGFIEGRLGVEVPNRFKSRLRSAKIRMGRRVSGPTGGLSPPLNEVNESGFPDVKIISPYRISENKTLVNETNGDSFDLPAEFLDEVRRSSEDNMCCIQAQMDSNNLYLFNVTSTRESPYRLYSINSLTGEIKWNSLVYSGTTLIRGSTGRFENWIHQPEVKSKNGNLYVFGFFSHSFYVEGFSEASGENIFRFSSSY